MPNSERKHLIDFSERVTESEAIDKMFHHLRLAAAYFEVTPEPIPPSRFMFLDDMTRGAAKAFVASLDKYFSDLKLPEKSK